MKLFATVIVMLVLSGCQQDLNPPANTPSVGSLQDNNTGDCLPKTVIGNYIAGTALASISNLMTVQVNVTKAGDFTIYTDTVNGYHFRATGTFTSIGSNTVILIGSGTPIAAGTNSFSVFYNTSVCKVPIKVLPAGTVPTSGAGTLGGASGACSSSVVSGGYSVGTGLTTADSVTVQVNVTTLGNYTIATNTVTGFSFVGGGTFTSTGIQNVVLHGIGTPTTLGAQTFTVTFGPGSCTFVVNVNSATTTNDYFPMALNNYWVREPFGLAPGEPIDSELWKVFDTSFLINGSKYKRISDTYRYADGSNSDSKDTLNFRKSNGDYLAYVDGAYIEQFDTSVYFEFVFLKDNVPQGTEWFSPTFSGTNPTGYHTYREHMTIYQKDVAVTIASSAGNVTYQNVIVVKNVREQLSGGVWAPKNSEYSLEYYARGVGEIKIEILNSGSSLPGESITVLRRYTLF